MEKITVADSPITKILIQRDDMTAEQAAFYLQSLVDDFNNEVSSLDEIMDELDLEADYETDFILLCG